jgi:lysophospholipase L1-like esterase
MADAGGGFPGGRFPLKTALAAATVAAVLTAWHMWKPAGGMDWRAATELPKLALLQHKVPIAQKKTPEPGVVGSGAGAAKQAEQPESALLIDNKGSLDRFYAGLAKLDAHAPDSQLTVVHFGDSPTTADLITGDVRLQLQARFGDAGQGFNLIAKPWAWYQHFNIDETDKGWTYTTAVGTMHEGQWGIGGATFLGSAGAETRYRLTGSEQGAVEIAYDGHDGGGSVEIAAETKVNGADATASLKTIDTGATTGLQFERVALPAGTKAVDLNVTEGTVKLYGTLFERATPGVVYDSIGLNGATTSVVARALNEEMMKESFAHLKPDLVVINFGTNESSFGSFVDKQYEGELRLAIARVRRTAPGADILIMSPMDRGERVGGDAIQTMATIPKIVEIQERVAAQTGCGFFNTFEAMGGDGTMQRWYERKPRLVGGDLIHPSPAGARIVATDFVRELMEGYGRFRKRNAGGHADSSDPR